jgi:RNA polymerase sigma-70 factor (ECF subfamily)
VRVIALEHAKRRERAYLRLVEPHRAELRAHCRRMLGSQDAAEDAVQEAMVRAWRALPRFAGRGSIRSWLYRIATNVSLDAMRSRGRWATPVDPRLGDEPLDSPTEDEREWREALQLTLATATDALPPAQLAVLSLRAVSGFSAAETGRILGMTVPAVNSALQRARANLRAARDSSGADEIAA